MGGAAVEVGGDAEVGRRRGHDLADRRRVVEDVAEVGLQRRSRRTALAPASAFSSRVGEQQLDARPASPRRCSAARARASPPPRPCCRRRGCPSLAFSQPPSTITGSIGTPPSSTVSRCAHSRIERSPRPGRRASRLPHSPRARGVLLAPRAPSPRSSACDALRALALVPERARDAAERGERVVQPRLLGVGGRPQALSEPDWKRPAGACSSSPDGSDLGLGRGARARRRARARRPRSRGTAARGARGGT